MFDPLFEGISWLLAAFYDFVPNYGFAIAMLTLTVYALLFPLTLKQTRSSLAMARLQPEIAKLKKQHKGDSRALMEAQQELFAREGVNPAASCLPMLLPMPVFIILWQVLAGLTRRTAEGVPDPKYLDHASHLYRDILADNGELVSFGVDLAKTAIKGPHASFGAALPFFILSAVAGGSMYFQMKRSQGRNPNREAQEQPAMQIMLKVFPVMTLVSSLFFPAGLGLYMTVGALFRIAQQEGMYRWDPHVVNHAKAAAQAIETSAVDTTAKTKPKPEPKKPGRSDDRGKTNGSDPSPAGRNSGRAQPKGTQGQRRKRKKSRR